MRTIIVYRPYYPTATAVEIPTLSLEARTDEKCDAVVNYLVSQVPFDTVQSLEGHRVGYILKEKNRSIVIIDRNSKRVELTHSVDQIVVDAIKQILNLTKT